MTRRPHAPLLHALIADAARHAVSLTIGECDERPWSSATFTGCRLTLAIAIMAGDPAPWFAALPEANFAIPRYLVADIAVRDPGQGAATLEVLLLEK